MSKLLHPSLVKAAASCQQKCLVQGVKTTAFRASATAAIPEAELALAKPIEQIPGFRSFPFIGTSWVFYPIVGKYKHEKYYEYDFEKHRRFGDISRDVFGGRIMVNVYNEKDIETLLRCESKFPVRGFLEMLLKYRQMRKEWFETTGVLLTNGQEWYDLRFKLQRHLMKPRTIDRYIAPVTEVARDFVDRIREAKDENNIVSDAMEYLSNWSLEAVALVGMDQRLGCLDANADPGSDGQKMIEAVRTSFGCMTEMEAIGGSGIPLWKYFPTPMWKKFVEAMDCFSETAYRRVQESMDSLKSKTPEKDELTVLQAMLLTKEIKPHEAMTMAIDMLMGGVDTTSNAMGFFLHDLATNPDKQEKLYQEIIRFLPSPSSELTPEALAEMRYLKLCLKESLRLHTIARMIVRTIPNDLVLSGYHVPRGTIVAAMMQVCARQERYFKNAAQFIPERWDDKDHKPSPFLHVPFGFGTRSCIGRRIAELEMWILTIEVLRNFKVATRQESLESSVRMALVVEPPLKLDFIDRN